MLQAIWAGTDAGRVILKMEKQIAQMDDEAQAAVFSSTVETWKLNGSTASSKAAGSVSSGFLRQRGIVSTSYQTCRHRSVAGNLCFLFGALNFFCMFSDGS